MTKEEAVRDIAQYLNFKQVKKLWNIDYDTLMRYISENPMYSSYNLKNRFDDFYDIFSNLRDIIDKNLDIIGRKKVKKDLQYLKKKL